MQWYKGIILGILALAIIVAIGAQAEARIVYVPEVNHTGYTYHPEVNHTETVWIGAENGYWKTYTIGNAYIEEILRTPAYWTNTSTWIPETNRTEYLYYYVADKSKDGKAWKYLLESQYKPETTVYTEHADFSNSTASAFITPDGTLELYCNLGEERVRLIPLPLTIIITPGRWNNTSTYTPATYDSVPHNATIIREWVPAQNGSRLTITVIDTPAWYETVVIVDREAYSYEEFGYIIPVWNGPAPELRHFDVIMLYHRGEFAGVRFGPQTTQEDIDDAACYPGMQYLLNITVSNSTTYYKSK